MKVIAFYLPQFHRVPENDLWWGEGYTEWTAVKSAQKIYNDHYQPHIPLNNYYYDLLQKETMQWQAELMSKYNVYGMCFYHYYFQNGKKLLEKPAENLLKWKDINMPFCFSWANETWARTWSKISAKNSWNSLKENNRVENDDGVLLKQDYGEEKDWEDHFNYLLPFFFDNRYIKIEGRPIFVVHKPDSITCLPQMIDKWNKLARKNNFPGLFFIASNSNRDCFDAYLQQEANFTNSNKKSQIIDYGEVCQKIIKNAALTDNNRFLCGFPGYDDTPRRGSRGEIVENSSPEKFYELMKTLIWMSHRKGNEFIFVNAWNEWGEGMYLEPDEKSRYGYLEALKNAFSDYDQIDEKVKQELITLLDRKKGKSQFHSENALYKKNAFLMRLYEKWLCIKQEDKTIQRYFFDKRYQRIAVYGLGMTGQHLLLDLRDSQIKIVYGIDRSGNPLNLPIPVYIADDVFPEADIIVVTVTYDFDNIYANVKDKFSGPIVSLEEIIDYVNESDCP